MNPADFAALGIDSATILEVVSWGFSLVVGSYFSGWVVGLAVDLVKKI